MLDDVKLALRISNTAFDSEINDLISAAEADLRIAGVHFESSSGDALIKRAVITYCKANFGYDNPDADRFKDSYIMLKQHLSLAGDYRESMV
ncbi:DNA-packaging protein [Domibacillus aminovorans]|uniref:DNA-packaging protein n=2 Tax=Domibacillus aminovorans TaxID=29332 RepID=A0A177L4Z3_9BACI|nr:DNA-packaging protein [Domibacillus aminovorans]